MAHLSHESKQYPTADGSHFWVLVLLGVAFAVIVQSGFFLTKDWMTGDLAYHRGVTYSMLLGDLQGQGPFEGLISYFGGLFPMVVAAGIHVTGRSFETVVSVISWSSPVLLVAAFAMLGRALWRTDGLRAGLLALMGTAAGPLVTDRSALWVDGVLPGSHNYWPVYPRDIALPLVVAASALALSRHRRVRWAGCSLTLAFGFLFHAQIGFFGILVVGAVGIVREARGHRNYRAFSLEFARVGAVFLAITSWWTIPRLFAVLRSNLELASFPRPDRLDVLSMSEFVALLGVTGLLAIAGLGVVAVVRGDWPERVKIWSLAWASVAVPVLVLGTLTSDLGIVTSRRSWLLVSPLLLVLAVDVMGKLRDLLPLWASVAALSGIAYLGIVPGAIGTLNFLEEQWNTSEYQGRVLKVDEWRPVWRHLRRHDVGLDTVVLASDTLSGPIWSWTGRPVLGMVLPGYMKLGFDLATETGISYSTRMKEVHSAFQSGMSGLCNVAEEHHAGLILLERRGALYGIRDINPASPYRVNPEERSLETIRRQLAQYVTYVDRNGYDALLLEQGAAYRLPTWASEVELLEIEINYGGGANERPIEVDGGRVVQYVTGSDGHRVVTIRPSDSLRELSIQAVDRFALLRILGFEPFSEATTWSPLTPGKLALLSTDEVCG